MRRLSRAALEAGALEFPSEINDAHPRPQTWGECVERDLGTAPRPCPYASCRWNLYLEVNEDTGSIKINFPDRDFDELADTCALRVAARGSITLEEVAVLTNLTRERIRQVVDAAAAKLRVPLVMADVDASTIDGLSEEGAVGWTGSGIGTAAEVSAAAEVEQAAETHETIATWDDLDDLDVEDRVEEPAPRAVAAALTPPTARASSVPPVADAALPDFATLHAGLVGPRCRHPSGCTLPRGGVRVDTPSTCKDWCSPHRRAATLAATEDRDEAHAFARIARAHPPAEPTRCATDGCTNARLPARANMNRAYAALCGACRADFVRSRAHEPTPPSRRPSPTAHPTCDHPSGCALPRGNVRVDTQPERRGWCVPHRRAATFRGRDATRAFLRLAEPTTPVAAVVNCDHPSGCVLPRGRARVDTRPERRGWCVHHRNAAVLAALGHDATTAFNRLARARPIVAPAKCATPACGAARGQATPRTLPHHIALCVACRAADRRAARAVARETTPYELAPRCPAPGCSGRAARANARVPEWQLPLCAPCRRLVRKREYRRAVKASWVDGAAAAPVAV